MDPQLLINVLNGLGAGLLLFMLSAGLTLIFSMLGVLNFAHASFYMLGAYLGYALSGVLGFWLALVAAPLLVGLLGAVFQRGVLRRVHAQGHVAELLVTFGLSYVVLEAVKLIWGLSSVPFTPPASLQGPAFTLVYAGADWQFAWGAVEPARCAGSGEAASRCVTFPATRLFTMAVALAMLLAMALALARTRIGLVIRAALTYPRMVESLGHDVPAVFTLVFGGGCALAALAGVVGGMTYITEPSMATVVGSIVFVVVVIGGLGSLTGAFVGSLLVGLLQTLPLAVDGSVADLVARWGWSIGPGDRWWPLARITLAQAAPVLPFLLLVVMLVLRPRGLLGARED